MYDCTGELEKRNGSLCPCGRPMMSGRRRPEIFALRAHNKMDFFLLQQQMKYKTTSLETEPPAPRLPIWPQPTHTHTLRT
jgi:hypothetical protein